MTKKDKQFYIWAGCTLAFATSLVASKMLALKKAKIEAEKAKIAKQHSDNVWKRLDDVRATLDHQLETAKFWDIVTRDL